MPFIYKLRNLFRKRRYKPLYKQFINLRRNVQYRRKISLFYFKKRKWAIFLNYYKRTKKSFKKRVVMFDHMRNSRFSFLRLSFKNRFSDKLKSNKKLSLFYGLIRKRALKKYSHLSFKNKQSTRNQFNSSVMLIELLEKRLDTVLYRSHFVSSIRGSQQLISHGHIYVNGNVVKSKSYPLKKGDIINIKEKFHKVLSDKIKSNHLWPIPPKYLQINYKTFQIIFHDQVKFNNLSTHFPFKLDLNKISRYH